MNFDTIIAVDWSARNTPSPKAPTKDAIFACVDRGDAQEVSYHRTRHDVMTMLEAKLAAELKAGRRVLLGFDFAFGYPMPFAKAVTGQASGMAVVDHLSDLIEDAPNNANNRFEVAEALNNRLPGVGPFWGRPNHLSLDDLPAKGSLRRDHGMPERRQVEQVLRGAQSTWKLYTTGSVGSQTLLGLPRLAQLKVRFGDDLCIWPLETGWGAPEAAIVVVEIYPSLYPAEPIQDEILDAAQVRWSASAMRNATPDWWVGDGLAETASQEGWIFGATEAKDAAATKRLPNDCFALPRGVHWTPVDEALDHLKSRLHCVVGTEVVDLDSSLGRITAKAITARRANPPTPNAAVDGYGFAHQTMTAMMPLVKGRAAAGAPFDQVVPPGHAIRILTGAALPDGVDTVVLEEDVDVRDGVLHVDGTVRAGANTRRAGEDKSSGEFILSNEHVLRAPDLALLAATGHGTVEVHRKLRVGILSSGDELVSPGGNARDDQIYDANGPMLRAMIAGWAMQVVDLGSVPDDRESLRATLDEAAGRCDAILVSGGASAGDEDHMSALLQDHGNHVLWRIAIKPGRPLALGQWRSVPIFGLPGNPVAAGVTALIFARPALGMLAGAGWREPHAQMMPAAFDKTKKSGRRELLRARLGPDGVELFESEGSGRVSSLSWADGLVELPDHAMSVQRGDLVRYLPYSALLSF